MEKFVFDVVSQTLTITAKFAKMMNDTTSDEYKLVQRFRKDFPNLTIAKKTNPLVPVDGASGFFLSRSK